MFLQSVRRQDQTWRNGRVSSVNLPGEETRKLKLLGGNLDSSLDSGIAWYWEDLEGNLKR